MRTPVVTGIGIVSPVGADRETTWRAVAQGRSAVAPLHPHDGNGKIAARVPREWLGEADAERDAFIRFALKAAFEAVEDSGIRFEETDRARAACFVGSSKGGVATFHDEMQRRLAGKPLLKTLLREFLPNAASVSVAERYDLIGPCGNVVGACATGALCIARAAELIEENVCDVALAGASDASITPTMVEGFDRLTLLAQANGDPAKACRPFDAARTGFVLGEGACVLVMEEAEHARQRGAKSYGVISGWSSTSTAFSMTGLDPDGAGIVEALRRALAKANLRPGDLDYINAHGTATRQNDVVETRAVKAALGEYARRTPLSSTKPVTGHLLGAAGSLEFALALLAMRDGFLPPTINLNDPDPECDLDYVPNVGRPAAIRHCASMSAGLGGSVCVLVAGRPDTALPTQGEPE